MINPKKDFKVNPYDIESITVLKDKAAELYGKDGVNGIILITTKKKDK